MSGFTRVSLQEYETTLTAEGKEEHTLLVVAESLEAAESQAKAFAEHKSIVSGEAWSVGPVVETKNLTVTYTEEAWKRLKVID